MAETTDKAKASTKPKEASAPAKGEAAEAAEPEKPRQKPPHIVMRALLGFSGLSLLVGFFLPWVRYPATTGEHATPEHFQNGLDLMLADDIQGTASMAILLVPILGALLSAASFMGFRYAAQTAIGVAVGMLAYGLYVLGSMFVQFTGYGLWTVAGGTFVILLLGVITYMLAKRTESDDEDEDKESSKDDAPKAAAKA